MPITHSSHLLIPFQKTDSLYYVDCHAKTPEFSVTIGGHNFPIDTRDQIVQYKTVNGEPTCISGTQGRSLWSSKCFSSDADTGGFQKEGILCMTTYLFLTF